jgi:hypothetical protein
VFIDLNFEIQINQKDNVYGTEGPWWSALYGSCIYSYLFNQCLSPLKLSVAFVGSSSLIATGGHSSENRNVCLWDTLLPPRSANVHGKDLNE